MLSLNKISKRFPDFSLEEVSFTVGKGDYFILLGESGAGKSMILETIAGLVKPDKGSILLEGHEITHEKIQQRGVGLVFQDHAVFPHMHVKENIAYSLHGSKLSKENKKQAVQSIAQNLNIAELLGRSVSTLSGGELQRVALARTLVQKPKVLLLDEPLASLDTRLKGELRAVLRNIHRSGQTILHVTHDYEEALSLGNRIAVIAHGHIIQEGGPEEVFHHPKSEFLAHFAGIRNFFPAVLTRKDGISLAITPNDFHFRILTEGEDGPGFVMIRGEDILLSNDPIETSATNNFEGRVAEIIPTPRGIEVGIDAGLRFHALITRESLVKLGIAEDRKIYLHCKATAVRFINK